MMVIIELGVAVFWWLWLVWFGFIFE